MSNSFAETMQTFIGLVSKISQTDRDAVYNKIADGWVHGWRPVRAVVEFGLISEAQLRTLLEEERGHITLDTSILDSEAFEKISLDNMDRLRVIPYAWKDEVLQVATVDELDNMTILELRELLGTEFKVRYTDTRSFNSSMAFIKSTRYMKDSIKKTDDNTGVGKSPVDRYKALVATGSNDYIDNTMEALLSSAISTGTSDIHIHHILNERGEHVVEAKLRSRGDLRLYDVWSHVDGNQIINRFRAAGEIPALPYEPTDGRYDIALPVRGMEEMDRFDFRLSFTPTELGEMLVIRLLAQRREGLVSLDDLYPPYETDLSARIKDLIEKPDGMFLVVGRTGDGKSTTLVSALTHIIRPEIKVVTVEEPVEYLIPGAQQVAANSMAGAKNSWENLLRSLLRSDPDVMLIGEIRDHTTATTAIKAAQTGHMIASTIHARTAIEAPIRFLEDTSSGGGGGSAASKNIGLANSLNGILAQRLIKVLCPTCSTGPITDKKPGRCEACRQEGWIARAVIGECITLTPEISEVIIHEGANPLEIRKRSEDPTFLDHAAVLLNAGRTTRQEIKTKFGELPELGNDGFFITKYKTRPLSLAVSNDGKA